MKLKHQLSIFNVITRLLLILVVVFLLPMVVEQVVYKHINKTLIEKEQKFIEHLNDQEINQFLNKSNNSDTYASFSILHDEFILLSKTGDGPVVQKSVFINEPRIIEGQRDDYRILQYTFGYENKIYELEVGSSLIEVKDLTFMIRIFILSVLLITLLISVVMDSFYIEYLFSPFYKIIDTKIRRVNDPNAFNYTTIKTKTADFIELDEVLNQLMIRMDGLFRQEKQFIANVSHEMLTPISILKNRFENLLQNESLNDTAVDKIAASMRTLDMLKKIINNLLLISRIDNNQFTETEKIGVKTLINEILEDAEDRIEEKELSVHVKLQKDFTFSGNRTLIRILFFNLLSNAIKYNKAGGSVTFTDKSTPEHYVICVSDTGIGMDSARLDGIFARFTRLETEQEGQGLGLAIANSIAQFHHIGISVTSVFGEGSKFYLEFRAENK